MSRLKLERLAGLVAALAIAATACGGGGGAGGDGLTGTVTGDGSSTVFPITEAITEEFLLAEPGIQVPTGVSGTGGGFEKFCNGETDFNNASRPISEEEIAACGDAGVDYVELQVAIDGLAVVVNTENDWAECLTVAELNEIWRPKSKVNNWSQVRGGFPDVQLKLFAPGPDSGTFDYFTEAINGEDGAQRQDYGNIGEDDNAAVTGVSDPKNTGGMAYMGYSFYVNNDSKVRALEVDNGEGCVAPTAETVQSNDYAPLSRPLFVYVRTDALEREEVAAYFDFYLEEVGSIIADVGYVAMGQELLAEQRSELQAATG